MSGITTVTTDNTHREQRQQELNHLSACIHYHVVYIYICIIKSVMSVCLFKCGSCGSNWFQMLCILSWVVGGGRSTLLCHNSLLTELIFSSSFSEEALKTCVTVTIRYDSNFYKCNHSAPPPPPPTGIVVKAQNPQLLKAAAFHLARCFNCSFSQQM